MPLLSDKLTETQDHSETMVERIRLHDVSFGQHLAGELAIWREDDGWRDLDTLRSLNRYVESMLWQYEDGRQYEESRATQRA